MPSYTEEDEALSQGKLGAFLAQQQAQAPAGLLAEDTPKAPSRGFSFNDPRMALLPEAARAAINKQALFKGLGDMGAGLLAQSGYQAGPAPTLGEAIGKAAPAFSKGVGDTIAQGLLTDETLTKRATEKARVDRINDFLSSSYISEPEKEKVRLAIDVGDTSAAMEHLFRAEEGLINKINVDDFTTESVERFKNSRNYSHLVVRDDTSGSGGGGVSAEKFLYEQAEKLWSQGTDPESGQLQILINTYPTIQALYDRATTLWRSGEVPFHQAIRIAAKEGGVTVLDTSHPAAQVTGNVQEALNKQLESGGTRTNPDAEPYPGSSKAVDFSTLNKP